MHYVSHVFSLRYRIHVIYLTWYGRDPGLLCTDLHITLDTDMCRTDLKFTLYGLALLLRFPRHDVTLYGRVVYDDANVTASRRVLAFSHDAGASFDARTATTAAFPGNPGADAEGAGQEDLAGALCHVTSKASLTWCFTRMASRSRS